ncbi:hypothetical protein [Thiorhodovibrio frisius]|uniref:Uncharacterized protein n=1 Tax=Thiorhodovibrio frisius TaxID=631362 RepID=H8Z1J7_9GAMM|nr:hypothetical protein [Thiorhodovibrio frisius]EIC21442.1 hypothetical protein Thi970DRAFT_01650 [Thiorhodovibrio frisius]WPL24028.1 hypothetical protein Thiofri_04239 [Thiorhodovibrio frisius]
MSPDEPKLHLIKNERYLEGQVKDIKAQLEQQKVINADYAYRIDLLESYLQVLVERMPGLTQAERDFGPEFGPRVIRL